MNDLTGDEFGTVQTSPLTQGLLEDFYGHIRASDAKADGLSTGEFAGAIVRAAVAVGWVLGITVAEVRNLPPRKVLWISDWVNKQLGEAQRIDPNWFGRFPSTPEREPDNRQS